MHEPTVTAAKKITQHTAVESGIRRPAFRPSDRQCLGEVPQSHRALGRGDKTIDQIWPWARLGILDFLMFDRIGIRTCQIVCTTSLENYDWEYF